jgi:2-octaprenylphenol hydroxylase
MSESQLTDFDVLVNGAGLVGSCCALLLARSGIHVAILDKDRPAEEANPDPIRVSALNHASQNILEHLCVWRDIAWDKSTAFERIEVWDALSNGTISFDAATAGLSHLGHIVANNSLCTALHQALGHCAEAVVRFGEHPVDVESSDSCITVTLAGGEKLRAGLLIGADGAHSKVRQLAGIAQDQSSYNHTAIVATVTPEQPHGACARQRFLPTGPLAFLPLAENQCSIVWSASTAEAERMLSLNDSAFATELAQAFDQRLGKIQTVSERKAFALTRRHASAYIGERIALIGDAAHTVHPLAGLGANQGLADAAALAQVTNDALSKNRDIGTHSVLRRYERWRRGENALVLQVMDGFHALFSSENLAITGLRGMGLKLTDQAPLLKNALMQHAIGLAGDIPRLARPL